MKNKIIVLFFLFLGLMADAQSKSQETFSNPILSSGADPYSTYHKGYYYYTNTLQDRLVLWKTKSHADLKNAKSKVIWKAPKGTDYSADIWAPEFHMINGKWYAYFAADNGDNNTHRMYALENKSSDPFKGNWEFKGKIAAKTDKWAIDGNVFTHKNQLYMIWAGWEGDTNGQQNIYIAKMKNPLEIEGDRVLISSPNHDWETHGKLTDPNNPPQVNVNEGPQFLAKGDKIFIVFSASGCWTDYYALGLLTFTGTDNLLEASAWKKSAEPIFKQSDKNKVYAPGHNSFFKSPDGKEDWILYHANSNSGEGCGNKRSPRMQKINWDVNGFPVFGEPVSEESILTVPSK